MFYFILKKVWLVFSVVLISGVQPSDSIIHIPISILFQTLSPICYYRGIEQSSRAIWYLYCSIMVVLVGYLLYT